MPSIEGEDALAFVEESLPSNFREVWDMEGQVGFAYFLVQAGRYRVNAFLQCGSVSIVFRHIKSKIPNFEELNLDKKTLTQFIEAKDGIVLLCGASGSGRSATMACLLNHLNHTAEKHVVSLEDSVEYNFIDHQSVFNQREIGMDTPNFKKALRAVLLKNPYIIIMGETLEAGTFDMAMSAAETGHLVFTTLLAVSA